MSPPELQDRLLQAYRSFHSYRDSGVLVWRHVGEEQQIPREIHFATYFTRSLPTLFRFDWSKHHPHLPLRHLVTKSVLLSNSEGVFRWDDSDNRLVRKDSLEMAIAGAMGVSMGAASHISTLLIPDFSNLSLTLKLNHLTATEIIATGPDGKSSHLRLTGTCSERGRVRLIVRQQDDLITNYRYSDGKIILERFHWETRCNEDFSNEIFYPRLTVS